MKYYLAVRREAEADIKQAYDYYESCRKGLGQEYLLSIEATLKGIQRMPKKYRKIHKEIRRSMVRRFPYGAYYLINDHQVIILAVMHDRQNPADWQQRN